MFQALKQTLHSGNRLTADYDVIFVSNVYLPEIGRASPREYLVVCTLYLPNKHTPDRVDS